ncbi:MAG: hypothetical protein AAB637_01455 [Patescibacteria group bacterium]
MHYTIQLLIDFLFPPSPEELKIRSLSTESLIKEFITAEKTEFPFINSIYSYKDPLVKELIRQIKYKKNKYAIKCASFALYHWLYKQNKKDCILIPIPNSKKRRKERGYNQCELLIDEIIKLDLEKRFKKNYDLLIRPRDIETQTLKNRNERIENTKNIFEVSPIQVNKKIIIIDDVTTTGSTLKEAYDKLLSAGYSDIEALTFAH